MAETADPQLHLLSGGFLIGGYAAFNVFNVGNESFQSVTWTVSGGKEQSYTRPNGTTTDLNSPITHNSPPGGGFDDSFSAYWNENPGNKNISAHITYTDLSAESLSLTVAVAEPTVNAFDVTVADATLGTYQTVPGGRITLFSPGIQYTATVTAPVNTEGGEFAFLQKVNGQETQNNTISGAHTKNTGWVLDDWTGGGHFAMIEGKTFDVPAGTTVSTPNRTDNPGPPKDDSPEILYRYGNGDDWNTGYSGQMQIQTYLVFRPVNGIWVKLSETEVYTMTGNATWVPDAPAALSQSGLKQVSAS